MPYAGTHTALCKLCRKGFAHTNESNQISLIYSWTFTKPKIVETFIIFPLYTNTLFTETEFKFKNSFLTRQAGRSPPSLYLHP